jgi:hypothetical protein
MSNSQTIQFALNLYHILFLTLSPILWWALAKPKKLSLSPPTVPQAPKYMTPLEAQFVLLKTMDARGLFATLLDWIKRGIITIDWGEPLHRMPYTYTIASTGEIPDTRHERILYQGIFLEGKRTKVTQEQVNFVMHKKWQSVRRLIHRQFSIHSKLNLYTKMASYTNFIIFIGVFLGYTMMTTYYMFLYFESELWTVIILACLFSMIFIAAASNTWLSIDKFLNRGINFTTSKRHTPFIRVGNLIGACFALIFSLIINAVLAFVFTQSILVFIMGMLYNLATATLIIRPRFNSLGEKFYVTLKDYQTYLIKEENEHIKLWIDDNPAKILDHLPFCVALGAYEGVFIDTIIDMQRMIDRNPNDHQHTRTR